MARGKNLVGLDIGASAIKLCEVDENRKGERSLIRFGYHPLPPETIVDGHIMNSAPIIDGLERLFYKSNRRDVAVRISGHSVIIKKITLPIMSPAELSEQISWEAEQHIPFDLNEVQIDYEVVQKRDDQGQMDVLLVAAKREEIVDITNLVTEAKLRPKVVDLDAFALQNCFEAGYGAPGLGQTTVLINSGASLTTLNILTDNTTAFTRDLTTAGNSITEEIQRSFNVGFEEAEELKLKSGDGPPLATPQLVKLVEQAIESLAGEIQRSLDFYLATSGSPRFDKILVTGGTSASKFLPQAIARRAGVTVERLDPLLAAPARTNNVDLEGVAEHLVEGTIAFGLALRKDKEVRG